MSNRQARREQMRTTRQQRAQRPAGQRPPSSSGGGSSSGRGGDRWWNKLLQPFPLIVAGVVVAGVIVIGFLLANSGSSDEGAVGQLEAFNDTFPFDQADGFFVGDEAATVTLTQFEDFQCPFCLRYTAEDEPTIIDEYVKTGKIRIEFRNLPILGQESFRSAQAGFCAAEQNKFWEYHNRLFLEQAEAGQLSNEQVDVGRFSDDNLRQFANDLGLDEAAFSECLDSEEALTAVEADVRDATSLGIRSTPGFLINGQSIGQGSPSTLDAWRTLLDEAIADASVPNATETATEDGTSTATETAAATTTATATGTGTSTGTATATATSGQ